MSFCTFLMEHSLTRWLGHIFGCSDPIPPAPPVPPNQVWTVSNGVVTVYCDQRHGGSIYSIVSNGYDYIPDTDQGGQVQTALQLDGGGESYNPTEGGSVTDAGGPTSSSIILGTNQPEPNILEISTKMAYWEPYQGQKVSGYTLSKRITIGDEQPNVFRSDITLDSAENHQTAGIEGLTAYVDIGLSALYCLRDRELVSLPYTTSPVYTPDVFVNSETPLIVASPDGGRAFAFYSPGRSYSAWMGAGAGTRNASNKLNAAGQGYTPFPAGKYQWAVRVVVGSLFQVRDSLNALAGHA